MNDRELDEMLNCQKTPEVPDFLRRSVTARAELKSSHWILRKGLIAASIGGLSFLAVKAVPQTVSPEARPPYSVLSEFVRYGNDGSSTVEMYSTSYNDPYGREIILARHLPRPFDDVLARMFDAAIWVSAPLRAPQAAAGRKVATECADKMCLSLASYVLPLAAGCVDAPADVETILNYATVAAQLPIDGKGIRRTVWMAPALGCFALMAVTEQLQADGSFRLLSGRQAIKVRRNP